MLASWHKLLRYENPEQTKSKQIFVNGPRASCSRSHRGYRPRHRRDARCASSRAERGALLQHGARFQLDDGCESSSGVEPISAVASGAVFRRLVSARHAYPERAASLGYAAGHCDAAAGRRVSIRPALAGATAWQGAGQFWRQQGTRADPISEYRDHSRRAGMGRAQRRPPAQAQEGQEAGTEAGLPTAGPTRRF